MLINQYKASLKWWGFLCLQLLGVWYLYASNALLFIYNNDPLYMSLGMIGLHFLFSCWFGYKTYDRDKRNKGTEISEVTQDRSVTLMQTQLDLGLLGTILGFIIILLVGFSGIKASDPISLQTALTVMSQGLGTALLTTGVGLISKMLLNIQYMLLARRV
jgi:nitrate reductase gamma subunit